MAVQAAGSRKATPTRSAARPAGRGTSGATGRSRRPAAQAKRTASRSAAEGRRVATRAADQGQRVASTARDQGEEVARTARTQSRAVARLAAGGAREVSAAVKDQAALVRDELAAQGRTVVDEARTKLEAETGVQTRRAAGSLARLADEGRALAAGRPEEAPTIREYVADGADRLLDVAERLAELADEVELKGFDGVVDDVTRFARRRPGTFLLAAAVAGFGVGRLVRATGDEDDGYADDGGAPPPRAGRERRSVGTGRRALPAAASNGTRPRVSR